MILVQLILAGLVAGQARDDLRVYRWKHNNPKEDPLQRKSFQALVPGTCDEEISIQVKGFQSEYLTACSCFTGKSERLKINVLWSSK